MSGLLSFFSTPTSVHSMPTKSEDIKKENELLTKPVSLVGRYVYLVQPTEKCIADIFSKLKEQGSWTELEHLIYKMPKGGILHQHLTGAVYASQLLLLALKSPKNLYYNLANHQFQESLNYQSTQPASELLKDGELMQDYLNSAGMRGKDPRYANGHDQFMNSFYTLESLIKYLDAKDLMGVIEKVAKLENVSYVELMVSLVALEVLEKKGLLTEQKEKKESVKSWMETSVKINFIVEISRNQSNDQLFEEQVQTAFNYIKKYQNVVAVNLVGPEDGILSQTHFSSQMEIIDQLWKDNGSPYLTLHAGELTSTFSSLDYMTNRIEKSIEQGHARRIGHGVSLEWEKNMFEVLKKMHQNQIALEVCFSSNKKILNVENGDHPAKLYDKKGVPLTLNPDDPAVTKTNQSHEFFLAYKHYFPSYSKLKEFARNSLQYAAEPGLRLYQSTYPHELHPSFEKIQEKEWQPTPEAVALMEQSDILQKQIELERAFISYEEWVLSEYKD